MIHNRGLDTDWTYEESVEHLQDSMLQDPKALDEFADDFFSMHFSKIRYETKNILVVDSTTPAPPSSSSANVFEANDDDEEVQSEVRLQSVEDLRTGEISYKVDHSVLSLPVHKVIADIFLNHILKLHVYSQRFERLLQKSSVMTPYKAKDIHVALLGAGGCVLPSHILHILGRKASTSALPLPKVRFDAVEPDAEVLKVATSHFDAHFNESLVVHETDGLSFVSAHNQRVKDVAASGVVSKSSPSRHYDSSGPQSHAPPESLVEGHEAVREALLAALPSQQNGLLLINVFGDGAWLTKTLTRYGPTHGFQRPFVVVIGHSEVTSENNYIIVTSPTAAPKPSYLDKITKGAEGEVREKVANKHLETGISRLEDLTNSLLISGSHMYTS
eukprot:gene29966-37106_t